MVSIFRAFVDRPSYNLSVILPPSAKMIIYVDTNILVSDAFLKYFSILLPYNPLSFSVSIIIFLIKHFLVILTLSDYSGTLCTTLDQPFTMLALWIEFES